METLDVCVALGELDELVDTDSDTDTLADELGVGVVFGVVELLVDV
jgi:hypothetical protein